jgi:glycosyltransferase involved in cell wall biosynthesis
MGNPFRLMKIALTQFRGVIIKIFGMFFKISSLNKKTFAQKILYLSYNGLLEPIVPSQVVPYLEKLAKRGYEFILVTYEKKSDINNAGKEALRKKKAELRSLGIDWRYLRYHKNPPRISTLFDLFAGMCYCLFLIPSKHVKMVHVRGITPGVIMLILAKILKTKILFDMRGLLAEEYVGGGLWKESGFSYGLVKAAEKHMLNRADGITVLTKKHLEFNKRLDCLSKRSIPMDVIPCCVDINKFSYDADDRLFFRKKFGFEDNFVLMYPGKIGTFYLMDEMLSFYKAISILIPNAVFFIISHDDLSPVAGKLSDMGIDKSAVRFARDVSFDEMPRYLRMADAGIFFINPYKKIGSSPIKMGEFLASGVPVIINPGIGDTEELVRDSRVGVIVERFDADCYKRAATDILTMLQKDKGLSERCINTARKYLSVEEGVSKYYSLYNELVPK